MPKVEQLHGEPNLYKDKYDPRWEYSFHPDGAIEITAAPPGHERAKGLILTSGGPFEAIKGMFPEITGATPTDKLKPPTTPATPATPKTPTGEETIVVEGKKNPPDESPVELPYAESEQDDDNGIRLTRLREAVINKHWK